MSSYEDQAYDLIYEGSQYGRMRRQEAGNNTSTQAVALAVLALVEEIRGLRSDLTDAVSEIGSIAGDLAPAMQNQAPADEPQHIVGWGRALLAALAGHAPRARCGAVLTDTNPTGPVCEACNR